MKLLPLSTKGIEFLAALLLIITTSTQAHATVRWNGMQSNLWSKAENWTQLPTESEPLVFEGNNHLSNQNNLLGAVGWVDFSGTGWHILGNKVSKNGNFQILTKNTIVQWALDTELVSGDFRFPNTRKSENSQFILSGLLSGNGDLVKPSGGAGYGKLTITHTNNSYTGQSILASGITEVTRLADAGVNSSLGSPVGDHARISLGSLTENLQATLSYIGTTSSSTNRPFEFNFKFDYRIVTIANNSPTDSDLTFNGTDGWETNYFQQIGVLKLAGSSTGINTINHGVIQDGDGTLRLDINTQGTWILNGENNYSGQTTIFQGQLRISHDLALGNATGGITIYQGGTLQLANVTLDDTLTLDGHGVNQGGALQAFAGANQFNGAIQLISDSQISVANATSSLQITGSIQLGNHTLKLDNNDSNNFSITGNISGQAGIDLLETNHAVTQLSGNNTYAGHTTVQVGHALMLNGTHTDGDSYAIYGTLGGHGTIASMVAVYNGGSIAPGQWGQGSTPDTDILTTANIEFQNGSTLAIELAGTAVPAFDQLNATGNITLGISTILQVTLIDDYHPVANDSFDILNWSGDLTGTFGTVQLPDLNDGLIWNTDQLYTHGIVSIMTDELLLGDVNGDGKVDGFDVDPFVDRLLNGPYLATADMDQNGVINGFDVDPFVAAILGNNTHPQNIIAIPEPMSLVYVALLIWVRKRNYALS